MSLSESDIQELRNELLASSRLRSAPSTVREEIVQDTLSEIATRFSGASAEERRKIGHTVVRYKLWSWRRGIARQRARHLESNAHDTSIEWDPAERAEQRELREELYKAVLELLSEPERRTLYLRFFNDMTAAQAAESMGVPLQRVYYLTRRAIENLQRALAAFPDIHER